jgi:hypothetical protein
MGFASTVLAEVLAGVAVAIVVGAGGYIGLVASRPKIHLRFSRGNAGSGPGAGDSLKVHWEYSLTFENRSRHDAYELELIDVTSDALLKLAGLLILKLPAAADITRQFRVEKSITRREIEEKGHPIKTSPTTLPPELERLNMVLRYKSRIGLRQYARLVKVGEQQTVTYHWRRPSVA